MNHKTQSYIFDFFQIFSDAFILLSGPIITTSPLVITIQVLALYIIVDAAWRMRRTKYYRVPDVGRQNELVTSGIYQYIRNPMYLSQLLFCGVLVIYAFSPIRLVVWVILLVNFLFKIRYEESLLSTHFPEFEAYKKRSWRLVPYIY